jgi:NAD-dependent glycerol-3-phosphate dehydrogenase N-terminus
MSLQFEVLASHPSRGNRLIIAIIAFSTKLRRFIMIACFLLCLILASFLHSGLLASEHKIVIVGSGNWGSAAARRVALNILDSNDVVGNQKYNSTVTMWVYEEEVRIRNPSNSV